MVSTLSLCRVRTPPACVFSNFHSLYALDTGRLTSRNFQCRPRMDGGATDPAKTLRGVKLSVDCWPLRMVLSTWSWATSWSKQAIGNTMPYRGSGKVLRMKDFALYHKPSIDQKSASTNLIAKCHTLSGRRPMFGSDLAARASPSTLATGSTTVQGHHS